MRPLSWWFPGHLGAVLGTAGLAVLVNLLSLPRSDLPSDVSPLLSVLVLAAAAGFLCLLAVGLLRLRRERALLATEFFDLARGGYFFLAILSLCVLGLAGLSYFPECHDLLPGAWWLAVAAWLALSLAWFCGLVFRPKATPSWALITPGWLLPGASLHALLLFKLALDPAAARGVFATGAFVLATSLIVFPMLALAARWLLAPLDPATFGPSQWINLGALGINALSAAQLAGLGPARQNAILTFCVVGAWIIGLAWLPALLAAGYWRHVLQRVPLTFVPENWALVFSPAVFGIATLQLPAVGAGEWTYFAASMAFSFSACCWALNLVMSIGARRAK